MRKIMVSPKELNDKIDFYYAIKKPYRYKRSGHSLHLEVNGVVYYAYNLDDKDQLPITDIHFISKVKRYIVKNGLHEKIKKKYKDPALIKFIDINYEIVAGECFDKCFCVDISKAYWASARSLGYISDDLYAEGLGIDKRVRLACLGTFAKKTYQFEFNGKKEVFKPNINPTHPWVFFNPANMIYKAMEACKEACGGDFLFYWTDGVYVKDKEAAAACVSVLKDYGFEATIDPLTRVVRTPTHFVTYQKSVYEKGKNYCIKTRPTE